MRSRTKKLLGLGAGAVVVVALVAKLGVKHTVNGMSVDEYEQRARETKVVDAPDGGSSLESLPGRVKAWFPGSPLPSSTPVESPNGPVVLHAFTHAGTRARYGVSWIDRHEGDRRPDGEVFEETARNLEKVAVGNVVHERDLALGKYPGKELHVSAMQPRVGLFRFRAFIVGRRVYAVEAFVAEGADVDQEVDRFFDSIVIRDLEGNELRLPPPALVQPDLRDVYVTMTHSSQSTRSLLVHEDGVVELVAGERVLRRTKPSVADLPALKRVFETAAWRALPEGTASMYVITTGGRTVRRADPLSSLERPFVEALSALGPLWIYAERAERP